MPRHFFHVEGDGSRPDEEGARLPGPEQARSAAVIAAGEMLRDADGGFWDQPEWRMRVIDEAGETGCLLSVRGTTGSAVKD